MKSLKISEVHNYPNELLKRLRGVNSPGKRKLVQDIKDSNWEAVYEELLYRIELYASNKVVNYTRKILAELVINIAQHQPAVLASALYEKNFGTEDFNADDDYVPDNDEDEVFLITDDVIADLVDVVEQNLTGAIDESNGEENDAEIIRNLSLLAINSYSDDDDDTTVLSSDSVVNDEESEYYGESLLDVIIGSIMPN